MKAILRRKNEQPVSHWAGGATTELFIDPPSAECAKRNFSFRISSATVETEESVFSDFSGYARHIMPLEGSMRLEHDGSFAADLQPYEAHAFDGRAGTRSFGTCVDFNLIHLPDLKGSLSVVRCAGSVACAANGHTGIFARRDGLRVRQTGGVPALTADIATLNRGDFLILENEASGATPCEIRLEAPDGGTAEPTEPLAVVARLER